MALRYYRGYSKPYVDETDTAAAIHLGMAKAFFADAWASEIGAHAASAYHRSRTRTISDTCGRRGCVSLSGCDILDVMPDRIDPAAIKAADALIAALVERNHGCRTIDEVFTKFSGELTDNAETWGHYAAMEYMGHGVGLWDHGVETCHGYRDANEQRAALALVIPYGESIALERCYIGRGAIV